MNKKGKPIILMLLIVALSTLLACSSKNVTNTAKNSTSKTKLTAKSNVSKTNEAEKSVTPHLEKEVFTPPYKASGQGVPVLMYHSVGIDKNNPVVINPQILEEQFKYLKDNGYSTITLDDLYSYLENDAQIPEKSVVLTFDDGYENNYTEMFPLLKKYGFRATIFMISSYVDKNADFLTSAQLKEMDAYGVDIESHTVNHEHLKTLTKDKQLDTITQSKTFLEKLLNKKINYIAYPYGEYNKDTLTCTETAGYKLALTTDGRWAMKKNGILSLDRVYISGLFSMDVFVDRITNPNYKFQ